MYLFTYTWPGPGLRSGRIWRSGTVTTPPTGSTMRIPCSIDGNRCREIRQIRYGGDGIDTPVPLSLVARHVVRVIGYVLFVNRLSHAGPFETNGAEISSMRQRSLIAAAPNLLVLSGTVITATYEFARSSFGGGRANIFDTTVNRRDRRRHHSVCARGKWKFVGHAADDDEARNPPRRTLPPARAPHADRTGSIMVRFCWGKARPKPTRRRRVQPFFSFVDRRLHTCKSGNVFSLLLVRLVRLSIVPAVSCRYGFASLFRYATFVGFGRVSIRSNQFVRSRMYNITTAINEYDIFSCFFF